MARISKEKQEEIRQKIKEVSRAKFEELGFDKTSTKLIAKEVGIAEGTLFNYFDSKTEIFFEAFGDDYQQYISNRPETFQVGENVSEILLNEFQLTLKMMLKIPRGIMGELTIATVRMAKRKPDKFRKLMEYDFKFIRDMASYTSRLIDKNILCEVDSELFAEILFSIIGYELLLYVYDTTIKKEVMLVNIRKKIDILVNGYIKEENNGN